jgi:hypothetical protein
MMKSTAEPAMETAAMETAAVEAAAMEAAAVETATTAVETATATAVTAAATAARFRGDGLDQSEDTRQSRSCKTEAARRAHILHVSTP